ARMFAARRAEADAVKNRIKEVEERARTFRLVSAGSQDSLKGLDDQEKWLLASVKEIEGTMGNALQIAECALRTHTVGAFLLTTIAEEVLRAMEVERVMGYIRKARDEKDRFFRAIEELNRAGSPDQVFLAVLESARQIAPLELGAVTLVSEQDGQRMHRIAC